MQAQPDDPLGDGERKRSDFVRGLVQSSAGAPAIFAGHSSSPRKIIQFWDDLNRLPDDVSECIATWERAEAQGFARLLFDRQRARHFIQQRLGTRYRASYDKCYHPAMQSDYFRLCYMFLEGGFYVDADDVYNSAPIEHLFNDGRLKLQPLCYDIATHSMVPPSLFTMPGADSLGWIFYFNNNPLIAPSGHPLIERALAHATLSLEKVMTGGLPEIQSTTGPGNLTASLFNAEIEGESVGPSILVLRDWEHIATSKWPLSYRNDSRNWRLSNRQCYEEPPVAGVQGVGNNESSL